MTDFLLVFLKICSTQRGPEVSEKVTMKGRLHTFPSFLCPLLWTFSSHLILCTVCALIPKHNLIFSEKLKLQVALLLPQTKQFRSWLKQKKQFYLQRGGKSASESFISYLHLKKTGNYKLSLRILISYWCSSDKHEHFRPLDCLHSSRGDYRPKIWLVSRWWTLTCNITWSSFGL